MKGTSIDKLVDSVPTREIYYQPCLLACCSPCLSWQCLRFLHEFLHPGHCEGPKECPLGFAVLEQGFVAKQILFGHSLAQCPFSLQRLQVSLLLLCSQEVGWPF